MFCDFFSRLGEKIDSDMLWRFVLFWVFCLVLHYVFNAMACYSFMNRRKIKFKYLAFVPVLSSTYALGSISDSINADYFNKTFSRFVILMLKIIRTCSLLPILFLLNYLCSLVTELEAKILPQSIFGDYKFFLYDLNKIKNELDCGFEVFVFIGCVVFFLVISVIYLIYLFKIYYNIFFEYSAGRHKVLIFISIISCVFAKFIFVPDILVLLLRNKQSRFEKLNRAKTYV